MCARAGWRRRWCSTISTLERLIEAEGPIAAHEAAALKTLAYRNGGGSMIELADLLDLVGGRVPLLIEIKSEWETPDARFLQAIARPRPPIAGPLALMSFDPAVMVGIRELAPQIPRGIVSGLFAGDCWWRDKLGPERAYGLTHLLESGPAAPDFYAYDVKALPTPGHALRARGHGPAAVHLDGADAGAARHGRPLGRCADLRGIRALELRAGEYARA